MSERLLAAPPDVIDDDPLEQADGAVTEAAVVRAIADDRPDAPIGTLRVPLPRIATSERRSDAARLMVDQRVDAVLVVADGAVAGIVTATDLVRSSAGR